MSSIYEMIESYEKDFRDKPVKVVEGYDFDQQNTLKRIMLYANGKFLDGDSDDLGQKIYFDVSTPVVRNAAKNIDLDTKDIQFRAVNGKSNYFRSWLYRRKAKDWMRENKIARKLNSIPEMVSGVGTVVAKRVRGSRVFEFVDLRNLACDASVPSLNDGWTVEQHFYTPNDLRAQKERGWSADAIEEAIQDFITYREEDFVGELGTNAGREKGNAQYIRVREFYGYVRESMLTEEDDDSDLVLANFIVILPAEAKGGEKKKRTTGQRRGLTLFKSKIDEMPYKELHYRKVPGRWLGRGLYEECFPMQEVENTRGNWMLMAMRLSQLIVFQTREKTVLQNILKDITNGSILKFAEGTGDMLTRLDTQSKDNGSNSLLAGTVRQTLQGVSNAYEVTTGQNLPSGTPFSLGAMMNQNAAKLFDFIREDYGLFLEEIFNDWVLPELEEEMSKESILEVVDQDELDYIREHFVNWKAWDTIKQTIMSGINPTKQQINVVEQFVRQQLEKQESVFVDIPKDFLKFEKRVTCMVTDEQESPAMMQTLTTIMQVAAQNPAVVDMPAFQRILDMVGLAKIDLIPATAPTAPAPPQQQVPVAA